MCSNNSNGMRKIKQQEKYHIRKPADKYEILSKYCHVYDKCLGCGRHLWRMTMAKPKSNVLLVKI